MTVLTIKKHKKLLTYYKSPKSEQHRALSMSELLLIKESVYVLFESSTKNVSYVSDNRSYTPFYIRIFFTRITEAQIFKY